MEIFPAIDLKDKKVVRLFKGDYNRMTVYDDDAVSVAKKFEADGAKFLHVVDLDGAKDGNNPNFEIVKSIAEETSLKIEIGGGIRSEQIIDNYIAIGVARVILGTIAIQDPQFVTRMISKYGDKIAVGVDILDDMVAIHGWTEISEISCNDMFGRLEKDGVKTVICTDISKDGAMNGTNIELYKTLSERYSIDIIASGGVSSIEDVQALKDMNIYGAILGKALYTGAIELKDAIEVAR